MYSVDTQQSNNFIYIRTVLLHNGGFDMAALQNDICIPQQVCQILII